MISEDNLEDSVTVVKDQEIKTDVVENHIEQSKPPKEVVQSTKSTPSDKNQSNTTPKQEEVV